MPTGEERDEEETIARAFSLSLLNEGFWREDWLFIHSLANDSLQFDEQIELVFTHIISGCRRGWQLLGNERRMTQVINGDRTGIRWVRGDWQRLPLRVRRRAHAFLMKQIVQNGCQCSQRHCCFVLFFPLLQTIIVSKRRERLPSLTSNVSSEMNSSFILQNQDKKRNGCSPYFFLLPSSPLSLSLSLCPSLVLLVFQILLHDWQTKFDYILFHSIILWTSELNDGKELTHIRIISNSIPMTPAGPLSRWRSLSWLKNILHLIEAESHAMVLLNTTFASPLNALMNTRETLFLEASLHLMTRTFHQFLFNIVSRSTKMPSSCELVRREGSVRKWTNPLVQCSKLYAWIVISNTTNRN